MVKLAEVCDIQMGSAPKGSSYTELSEGIPLVAGASDYGELYPLPKKATTEPTQVCQTGDLIICVRATIGDLNWADKPYCLGRGVAGLRSKAQLDSNYLFYFIRANEHVLYDNSTGSTFPQINKKTIENLLVPLPPVAIQKSIAEKLGKAEMLVKSSLQMEAELNALAKAVFLEMFGDPVCNTKRWPTKTLSQVVSISSGGTPSKSNDSYWQGNFPWVSPKDMKIDYLSDAIDHISDLVFEETNIKKIPEGTILVVVRGMILAHSIPLAMNLCDIAINQDIKALTVCNDGIETEFLFHCLKNQKDHILSKVSTAAHGTKRLDTPDLLGVEIIVPPLDLQYKYVEIMKKNARMVERYKQSSLTNKQLFDSLMQRAFSGKLDLKKVA
jgi:Restriction endonuclease S subunits